MSSPFAPWLDSGEPVLLDGGLGTELERRGFRRLGMLWSAALVRTNEHAIRDVHHDYLEAGADVISTATFQASIPTLRSTGLHRAEAEEFLRDAIAIAALERDLYMRRHPGARRPLVAASVGPFGASLQNGAEYTGDYEVSSRQLVSYHVERLRVLSETDADFIACETIPSLPEALVLMELLAALPFAPAWISFTCRDATHLADGNELREALIAAQDVPNLCAIGVNCIGPELAMPVLETLLQYASAPIIVYPNACNSWDFTTRQSSGMVGPEALAEQSRHWVRAGAQIVGGCCSTTPDHIRALARHRSATATSATTAAVL